MLYKICFVTFRSGGHAHHAFKIALSSTIYNRIGSEMVSLITTSVVYRGIKPQLGQSKHFVLIFAASPLST